MRGVKGKTKVQLEKFGAAKSATHYALFPEKKVSPLCCHGVALPSHDQSES